MPEPRKRVHPKLKDDDSQRQGYLLGQKAINYVRQLQLEHAIAQIQQGKTVTPLTKQLLLPGRQHPDLTWPVYIGEKGEAIAIYTEGKLGRGAFGGVFIGVNLDTGEPRAIKIQFPKNAIELSGIREEESVLATLGRFDDRLEIKNTELAMDFVANDYLAKIKGLSEPFIKLNLLSEGDFRALIADGDVAVLLKTLLNNINDIYGEDFSRFKINFLANGGERFVDKELEMDPALFLKNMDAADLRYFLSGYYNDFVEQFNSEIENINEFIEVGAQELAWGLNLIDFKEESHSDLEKLDVAIKVLEQIDALHNHHSPEAPNGLVHRDIKSANIMWDSETQTPTIVDMGFTRPMDANKQLVDSNLRGTPCAIAPEAIIALAKEEDPIYSPKTDMYAAGVVLLDLYSESEVEIPFQQEEGYEKGAFEQALEVQLSLNENPSYSGLPSVLAASATDVLQQDIDGPLKSIYATIKKMIEVNPNQRATFSEAIEALKQVREELTQTVSASSVKAPQPLPVQSPAASSTLRDTHSNATAASSSNRQIQSQEWKNSLDIAIEQMKAILQSLAQEPDAPRAGSRVSLLKQAPTPKMVEMNYVNYIMRELISVRNKDHISAENMNALFDHFARGIELTGESKHKLREIETDLRSQFHGANKENRSDLSLK